MDTGIDAIIKVYAREELEETAKDVSLHLEENIKNELYPGHGYDTGDLQSSIRSNIQTITDDYALVTGTYTEHHGDYVLAGVRGKARVDPIDFLGDGLEKTVAMYG